jgi:hypothetical protein
MRRTPWPWEEGAEPQEEPRKELRFESYVGVFFVRQIGACEGCGAPVYYDAGAKQIIMPTNCCTAETEPA